MEQYEYLLNRHSKFLEKLKRRELLHIVLKKCICHAEELEMKDVRDFLWYENLIKTYFRSYTKPDIIDFLQYEDVQQCVRYISRR